MSSDFNYNCIDCPAQAEYVCQECGPLCQKCLEAMHPKTASWTEEERLKEQIDLLSHLEEWCKKSNIPLDQVNSLHSFTFEA